MGGTCILSDLIRSDAVQVRRSDIGNYSISVQHHSYIRAAENKGCNWGMQIDWWLQPRECSATPSLASSGICCFLLESLCLLLNIYSLELLVRQLKTIIIHIHSLFWGHILRVYGGAYIVFKQIGNTLSHAALNCTAVRVTPHSPWNYPMSVIHVFKIIC